jgi:hypothetical protein
MKFAQKSTGFYINYSKDKLFIDPEYVQAVRSGVMYGVLTLGFVLLSLLIFLTL